MSKDKVIIKCEFPIKPGVPTFNNRVYPREVLEKAVKEYKRTHVDNNTALVTSEMVGKVRLKHVVGKLI